MKGRILVLVQFGCLLVLLLQPASEATSTWQQRLALTCICCAAVILATALINLRQSVTVFPEPRKNVPLITHGIYTWVRHPMYLAVLLFGVGLVLSAWNVVSVCTWVVLFIDLQIKFRYEDRLLAATWPDAGEYQRRVGALLPRLRVDKI